MRWSALILAAAWLTAPLVAAADEHSSSQATLFGHDPEPFGDSLPAAMRRSDQKGDLLLMSRIRRLLVRDRALSVSAKNIHLDADAGRVTLSGKVRSAEDLDRVERAAASIAGASNVVSRLQVAP